MNNITLKTGNKIIIGSFNFISIDNEDIQLEFERNDFNFKLRFRFIADKDVNAKSFSAEPEGDEFVTKFINCNDEMGHSSKTHYLVASINNNKIYYSFWLKTLGNSRTLLVQILEDAP
jgi:hypothetical protein